MREHWHKLQNSGSNVLHGLRLFNDVLYNVYFNEMNKKWQ